MDSATGSIHLGDPGVDRHHLIIQNTHCIFPSSSCNALLPSFCRSTQFVWFTIGDHLYISSDPLPTILEIEPLSLTNYLRIPGVVRPSVDDELSTF